MVLHVALKSFEVLALYWPKYCLVSLSTDNYSVTIMDPYWKLQSRLWGNWPNYVRNNVTTFLIKVQKPFMKFWWWMAVSLTIEWGNSLIMLWGLILECILLLVFSLVAFRIWSQKLELETLNKTLKFKFRYSCLFREV